MSIASLLDKQACLSKMNQYTIPFLKRKANKPKPKCLSKVKKDFIPNKIKSHINS